MRKLCGLLAGLVVLAVTGTALASPGATDVSGDFLDVGIAVTPPISGTVKAPRGVGLSFSSLAGNRINANDQAPSTSIVVRLHQNFVDNGLRFPSCAINPMVLSKCGQATRIGTGTAEGELLSSTGGPPTYVPATLAVYNGKPYGADRGPTTIFIASLNGVPSTELDFAVKRAGGGLTFTQIQFPNVPASGPPIFLAKFNFSIPDRSRARRVKGKTVRTHLVDAPTSCHGAWTFSQTLTYASRPPLTATSSQPCVKR